MTAVSVMQAPKMAAGAAVSYPAPRPPASKPATSEAFLLVTVLPTSPHASAKGCPTRSADWEQRDWTGSAQCSMKVDICSMIVAILISMALLPPLDLT